VLGGFQNPAVGRRGEPSSDVVLNEVGGGGGLGVCVGLGWVALLLGGGQIQETSRGLKGVVTREGSRGRIATS